MKIISQGRPNHFITNFRPSVLAYLRHGQKFAAYFCGPPCKSVLTSHWWLTSFMTASLLLSRYYQLQLLALILIIYWVY